MVRLSSEDYEVISVNLPHPEVDEAYVSLRALEKRHGDEYWGARYNQDGLSEKFIGIDPGEEDHESIRYGQEEVDSTRSSVEKMSSIVLDFYSRYIDEIHENALKENENIDNYLAMGRGRP